MTSLDLPPSDEVLRQFLLGQLAPEELEVVTTLVTPVTGFGLSDGSSAPTTAGTSRFSRWRERFWVTFAL